MILPADINSWDDERYFLWKERAAIMEVEGKMSRKRAEAEWDCLPACAFGAPHERDRLYAICYPNAERCENEGRLYLRQKPGAGAWWLSEPSVHRVVNGVSGQVGSGGGNPETAALANAVLPQIAEWIGRRIVEAAEKER